MVLLYCCKGTGLLREIHAGNAISILTCQDRRGSFYSSEGTKDKIMTFLHRDDLNKIVLIRLTQISIKLLQDMCANCLCN